ncbi:MAG TPA: glycosyltransferase family 2 protein [Patescibacteria group bacterium]
MKLIVQIPCYNEEETLPLVVNSIPRHIDGVDKIEVLVVDDGSHDNTYKVARRLGVDHIVRHRTNKGLAVSFQDGINECIRQGADIIVNTDADNQYPQSKIPQLIEPILSGKVDMVVADRQTAKIEHFSKSKKALQWLGSTMVRKFSQTTVPDAVSGFRAYSRDAILQLNIVTNFSYCIETIIQAQHKKMRIGSIQVVTNPPTRKSRLFKNSLQHIQKSTGTMLRVYAMYQPLNVFLTLGLFLCLIGLFPALRFLYFFLQGQGNGHVQSLIFASITIMVGFNIIVTGLVADLISINRKLLENALLRIKNIEINELPQE